VATPAVFGILVGIDALCVGEQPLDLVLELLFSFGHPLVAHRLVLGPVRLELRAVDGDVPQLDQSSFLAQPQDLQEQSGECIEVLFAERGDRVVVGMLVAREHPKRHVFVGCPLDAPRRRLADAVRVYQQRHQHRRVVARPASCVLRLVDCVALRQVELRHNVENEQGKMPLR